MFRQNTDARARDSRINLVSEGLWKSAADVGVAGILLDWGMNDEDNVVFRLEGRDDSSIAGFVGYGLLVDLRDDGALGDVEFVSKGTRANGCDHNTGFDSGFGRDGRRDG